MSTARNSSRPMPQASKPTPPMPRRETRRSRRTFHAAPLMLADLETEDVEPKKESILRRFFRAIGFGCFMTTEKTESNKRAAEDWDEKSSLALRAIKIDIAQDVFNNDNEPELEDGSSVYSSYYDGKNGRDNYQYQLYLGTEKTSSYTPRFASSEAQAMDLSELRSSMSERQLPVFFAPPPQDAFNSCTPRGRTAPMWVSPRGRFSRSFA